VVHNDLTKTISCILAAVTLSAGPGLQRTFDLHLVGEWIEAVRVHQPGVVDAPLIKIAEMPTAVFDEIRVKLRAVLEAQFTDVEERNAILRRGALLHTDIALLLPQQAAAFTKIRVLPDSSNQRGTAQVDSVVLSSDGQFAGMTVETAHWWFASELLKQIRPEPGSDPFVAAWHRAAIAHFESTGAFGGASYAVPRALEVLPNDPIVLMYAGAVHDVTASNHIQSLKDRRDLVVADADAALKKAERLFRRSVDAGGPPEAQIRLGRVLGALGRHQEAADVLRLAQNRLAATQTRLMYFASLFLGSQEMALGHVDAARAQFGRARAAIPDAQSAIIALADACFKAGQQSCASDALADLEALSFTMDRLNDPWVRYYVSQAADADEQMEQLRDSLSGKAPR
jgi:tetratricopeptide (TPR) repeat protein